MCRRAHAAGDRADEGLLHLSLRPIPRSVPHRRRLLRPRLGDGEDVADVPDDAGGEGKTQRRPDDGQGAGKSP